MTRHRSSTSARARRSARLPSVASYAKIDDDRSRSRPRPSIRSSPIRCSGSWSRARRNMGEARQGLGQVRQPALRHRPVQAHPPGAARARRADQERRLLGPEAPSEGRQDRAGPDAGSADAHQCAARRPGRLDRDAGARCGAAAQIRRHEDRRQRHAARLELPS